jgi:uncharacterized membrane protein HdeD (DUF308 family)
MIVTGVLAIIVGIIALAWPSATVLALVVLFAVYAFSDSAVQGMRAFGGASAGPVMGHLLLGVIDIAAGLVAIIWPGPTALVLVFVVAAWAVVAGMIEFVAGFGAGETAGTHALFIIGGLISVAFGLVLFARPGVGALTLALLFGMFALIYGISQVSAGIQLRDTWAPVPSVLRKAA